MQLLGALLSPLRSRLPLSCALCIWVCGLGSLWFYTLHLFWIWWFFDFWTLCNKPLWTLNSWLTNPIFLFLGESDWVSLSALFCAGWHTLNRSVTVLNFMSMVAITISRYRLQREGGWVPLLLWIVLFEPPTPPTFSECGISLLSLRVRKTVIFVSLTPRYECILALCLFSPESGLAMFPSV